PSILGHEKLPTLTHEDGMFLGSKENRALDTDENDHDHLAEHRDELYAEFKAQIERYIELVGHKPDYIHNHAYGTKTTDEVTRTLAKEYGVLCSVAFMDRPEVKQGGMGWYVWGGPEAQLNEDPISYITQDKGEILNQEYGYIISHCGYADADLFKLTSFSTCRVKDLEAMTSEEVKNWVKENNIELASFKDLPKEWI
ncbi:MAG: ChbG/HpnK family deacetylase, partial [Solobacterium sp.]|nr:ChbG/HpnK family deacetylase [Solobacterium sp.]